MLDAGIRIRDGWKLLVQSMGFMVEGGRREFGARRSALDFCK
jgi:hypothetical protein